MIEVVVPASATWSRVKSNDERNVCYSCFVVGVAIGNSGDPSVRGYWDCHTATLISNLLSSAFHLRVPLLPARPTASRDCLGESRVLSDGFDQFGTIERFGGVVVAAGVKTLLAIAGHGVRGQRNDWAGVMLLPE